MTKLRPDNVFAGQLVSSAILGDFYDEQIESVSATGKTIILNGGTKARWSERRQRYQIGGSDSGLIVINRTRARLNPHV